MEYSDLNDSEVEIELWDDPTEVSSDFNITGNSTCDGMLTTHDITSRYNIASCRCRYIYMGVFF